MLKKLIITTTATLISVNLAFAEEPLMNNTSETTHASSAKHKMRHHKKHHTVTTTSHDFKGEITHIDYKGMACAPSACIPAPFTTGLYAGFGVGSRVNYLSSPVVYNGLEGSVFGGYSMIWDQIYGAIEISLQDSAEVTNYRSNTGSVSSNWGYGLSILPGYMITDTVLGYLRLGVVSTRFATGNSSATGGQTGFGLQTALTPSWDLRGEYIYSFYNSIRIGNPKAQQFNLGLVYKFEI